MFLLLTAFLVGRQTARLLLCVRKLLVGFVVPYCCSHLLHELYNSSAECKQHIHGNVLLNFIARVVSETAASCRDIRCTTYVEVNEVMLPDTGGRPCAFGAKKRRKIRIPPHSKHNHQNHSSMATAANSGRVAATQVPRASLSSRACVDSGFVDKGYVQLSQSTVDAKTRQTVVRTQLPYEYSSSTQQTDIFFIALFVSTTD